MLKKESFQLYSEVEEDVVAGVVKSQTDEKLLYACRLNRDGTFSCCTQNLRPCGGLRGIVCKHILVLMLGLARSNRLSFTTATQWILSSKFEDPSLEKDKMTELFLKYNGAEEGEIDWRPTTTIPEDYY